MDRPDAPVVTIVHTSFLVVEPLGALFDEIAPDVELRHVVDDGLLDQVVAEGGVSEPVRERLIARFTEAAGAGCDVVLSQCSSVGEVAEEAAAIVAVPIVRIDAPMAEEACRAGSRIGVVATLGTTLGPTRRLIEESARSCGVEVTVEECLVEGAFDELAAGRRDEHDAHVLRAVSELRRRADVVVCAQGSMARILPQLSETGAPVLTSPRSGIARVVALARRRAGERAS
jgi:Asp/Glu/hydantoin racemase